MSRDSSATRKPVGGLIFGLIFLLAGSIPALFTVVLPIHEHLQSSHWPMVPAQLHDLQLDISYGDSTTYRVSGFYDYVFSGRSYRSDTISLYSGYDNVGDYWQVLHQRLEQARQRNQILAWVNPDNPQQALLDRTLRWDMMVFGGFFLLIFGGVGIAVMVWSLTSGVRREREQKQLAGDADAAADGIPSNERHSSWILLLMGAFFILLPSPALIAIPEEWASGNYLISAVLLFPAAGAGMLWAGMRARRLFRRIGRTPLFPDPLPGCAGGQAGGYIEMAGRQFKGQPQGMLSCVHTYSSGSGKNRSSHREILWQEKRPAVQQGQRLYLQFDVPAGQPATGRHKGYRGDIHWELQCEGEVLMTDRHSDGRQALPFSRSWQIPVIAGSHQAAWQIPDPIRQQLHDERRQQAAASAAEQIAVQQQGDVLHLDSRAGRHAETGAALTLFGCIFAAVGVFMVGVAREEGGMLWLFPLIFTPIGLLLTGFGLLWLGKGLQADIRPGSARIVRRFMGITLYQRQAQLQSPEQLSIRLSLTSTSNNTVTEYFRIELQDSGKTLVLAEGIAGRDAAEQIRQQMITAGCRHLQEELGG